MDTLYILVQNFEIKIKFGHHVDSVIIFVFLM